MEGTEGQRQAYHTQLEQEVGRLEKVVDALVTLQHKIGNTTPDDKAAKKGEASHRSLTAVLQEMPKIISEKIGVMLDTIKKIEDLLF